MWKKSVRFVCRYIAIGVLIGMGFYAVDEIHWRLVGSERAAELQQAIEKLNEFRDEMVLEPLVNSLQEKQSEPLPSSESTSVGDLILPTPYFVNGEVQGYRVYPGADRNGFRSLGLMPGDLVTQIDGQPLNTPDGAVEQFGKLLGSRPMQLRVLRGDEPMTIEVNVD